MPIFRRWTNINRWNLARVPDDPGIYEIGDRWGNIIDIGGSENLAYRIPRKVQDSKFVGQAWRFRYEVCYDWDYAEAEQQARFMARHGIRPRRMIFLRT